MKLRVSNIKEQLAPTKFVNGMTVPATRRVDNVEQPVQKRTTSKVILGVVLKKYKIAEDGKSMSVLATNLPYFDPDLFCEIGGEDIWINFNDRFDPDKFARQIITVKRLIGKVVTIKATESVDSVADKNVVSYFGTDIKSGVRTTQAAIGAPIDGVFLTGQLSVMQDDAGNDRVSILVGNHKIPGTEETSFHWINITPPEGFDASQWDKVPVAGSDKMRLKNAVVAVDVNSWQPTTIQMTSSSGRPYTVITGGSAKATAIYSGELPVAEETAPAPTAPAANQ